MDSQGVVLIVVSGGDIASTNQADIVRTLADWKVTKAVEGMPAYAYLDVRMWIFPKGVLREDDISCREA